VVVVVSITTVVLQYLGEKQIAVVLKCSAERGLLRTRCFGWAEGLRRLCHLDRGWVWDLYTNPPC
jgi:hypothetical protein